ncbi:MAG: hypothetical protein JWP97_868 [Labilithrix sp.]|nr:hypothetical protein [Labilithrix sp.]
MTARHAPALRLSDRLRLLGGAFAHRVRASLTVLGVVIGTASIVLLASMLYGGKHTLVAANQSVSDDDIIRVGTDAPPPAQKDKTTRPLSRADADALERDLALGGAKVAAESSFDAWARARGERKRVAVVSTGSGTMSLYRLRVASGRALDDDDRAEGRRVCVIGHEVKEDLFPGKDARGERLEIDGELFAVVGVLEEKPMIGSTTSTYRWDRKVMIPQRTYDSLYAPSHEVKRIFVRPAGGTAEDRRPARASIERVLLARHLGVKNFDVEKADRNGTEQLIMMVIQILVLGTGALAVFASGINIMNVMLVTVSERTREIGLRRALGATQRAILVQFVLEATALSAAGALAGSMVGSALSFAVALWARATLGSWDFALPAWSFALGITLSLLTGLGFGLLPAWRASRIAPIDALRSE